MLQHAQRVSGSVSQTCRFFGISRSLYYIWKNRFESHIGMQYADGYFRVADSSETIRKPLRLARLLSVMSTSTAWRFRRAEPSNLR
jgi:hypothetical protein